MDNGDGEGRAEEGGKAPHGGIDDKIFGWKVVLVTELSILFESKYSNDRSLCLSSSEHVVAIGDVGHHVYIFFVHSFLAVASTLLIRARRVEYTSDSSRSVDSTHSLPLSSSGGVVPMTSRFPDILDSLISLTLSVFSHNLETTLRLEGTSQTGHSVGKIIRPNCCAGHREKTADNNKLYRPTGLESSSILHTPPSCAARLCLGLISEPDNAGASVPKWCPEDAN